MRTSPPCGAGALEALYGRLELWNKTKIIQNLTEAMVGPLMATILHGISTMPTTFMKGEPQRSVASLFLRNPPEWGTCPATAWAQRAFQLQAAYNTTKIIYVYEDRFMEGSWETLNTLCGVGTTRHPPLASDHAPAVQGVRCRTGCRCCTAGTRTGCMFQIGLQTAGEAACRRTLGQVARCRTGGRGCCDTILRERCTSA
jgi:hypothetical protein